MLCSKFAQLEMLVKTVHRARLRKGIIRIWYVPYAYVYTVRVWYGKSYRTRMVCTIRVWYMPYAYGTKYAYGIEHAYFLTTLTLDNI